jgi:hypothetical protein
MGFVDKELGEGSRDVQKTPSAMTRMSSPTPTTMDSSILTRMSSPENSFSMPTELAHFKIAKAPLASPQIIKAE